MSLPIALDYRPALLSRSGIARATRELATALAHEDLDVHLFGHSFARARCATEVPERARLHRLPIPGRCLPALGRLGLGADRLAGGVRVFHWTDYVQPPVVRARAVLTVHDLAFVRNSAWHGDNAETLRQRTLTAIAGAAAVITPSRTTAADLRAFAPEVRSVHVVPFGADHVPVPTAAHPLRGRPYALCLGTIEPRKNHRTLLAAWHLLREPRPLLVVVGTRGWQCDDIVRELSADAEHVQWRADASDAAVWPLLQHARLLVYPSLWEGFGFPPLEAMQLGVPVVAHDVAPLRELGDGALELTDATDAAALAATIDRVLHDETLRARLGAAGRARAATFRWRTCAAAHAAIYREVAR
ncbi:MAG TPA: glycosyltransferase family 1 protein [Planctomycetota bacterium]|nr:glycosyltransferase family 1 protein [Planctomycetota bacterium]